MDKTATEQELLTAAEVAARLAMKESTIRAWLLARRLAQVRVGRRAIRIPASEIKRIIAEGTVPVRRSQSSRSISEPEP